RGRGTPRARGSRRGLRRLLGSLRRRVVVRHVLPYCVVIAGALGRVVGVLGVILLVLILLVLVLVAPARVLGRAHADLLRDLLLLVVARDRRIRRRDIGDRRLRLRGRTGTGTGTGASVVRDVGPLHGRRIERRHRHLRRLRATWRGLGLRLGGAV